jgi:hypothetical protein
LSQAFLRVHDKFLWIPANKPRKAGLGIFRSWHVPWCLGPEPHTWWGSKNK